MSVKTTTIVLYLSFWGSNKVLILKFTMRWLLIKLHSLWEMQVCLVKTIILTLLKTYRKMKYLRTTTYSAKLMSCSTTMEEIKQIGKVLIVYMMII
jgi:hypothetical protein